ncbi:MAG: hypothetical protein QJR01_01390 [Kyrpidia sp.]|nr:hypothetical protein [Kyrpidia sp.]
MGGGWGRRDDPEVSWRRSPHLLWPSHFIAVLGAGFGLTWLTS